jgi:hypothetical protein
LPNRIRPMDPATFPAGNEHFRASALVKVKLSR